MKVLVTGSGGYIGRHVVKELLDMGHSVIAADIRNDDVDARAIRKNVSIFDEREDIFDFLDRPDVCIHMAWRNGFNHNAPTHMGDLSGHFNFLTHMIEGGLKNVAVMGTMHEVGYWEGAIGADTPCNPLSQYGVAKNALRQAMLTYVSGKDVNLYWLRAFYILGDDTRNKSVFSKLLESANAGEPTFPFTSGKNKYDFIDVETLAKYIAIASTQRAVTGVINVCSGVPVSLGDKAEEFIKEKGLSIRLNYGAFPDRAYDSPGIWGDAENIRQILGNYEHRTAHPMRIVVTGVTGQLGYEVVNDLNKRGHIALGIPIEELDITDAEKTKEMIVGLHPDAVIHCAAYTNVDGSEEHEAIATSVNVEGTKNVIAACRELDCKVVYISTDYVFDGSGNKQWQVDDTPNPLSVYGRTKLAGEECVRRGTDKYFIVRTSWVFGNGNNFIKTMLRLADTHKEITVVNDQIGSPTYAHDLARLLVDMVETEKYGTYHATNENFCSWYEFAGEIFKMAGKDVKLIPVSSVEYKAKATRPLNSRLSKEKLDENGFTRLPSWQDALKRYLEEIGKR